MLEDVFGTASWPLALIAIAITAAIAFNVDRERDERHSIDSQIVDICAVQEAPASCAQQIRKALER